MNDKRYLGQIEASIEHAQDVIKRLFENITQSDYLSKKYSDNILEFENELSDMLYQITENPQCENDD